ncbi:hypothetical protein [Sphaerisporangium corydalis]|uniref:Uncharacterized protein n=1 Tax=Sphaerisporangium corydalis TaxID=1441875 RepID=A0ABV9EP34_9ACTN|nr:hypothetical protein [Sphaerisporangium corydalis]
MARDESDSTSLPEHVSRRKAIAMGGGAIAAIGGVSAAAAPAAAGAAAVTDCPGSPLQISASTVYSNLRSLYTTMSTNNSLQAQFIQDPSGVLAQYGMQYTMPADATTAANRLLFSILSNPAFREWLRSYAAQHIGTRLPPYQAANDISAAIQRFGDPNLITAMVESATVGQPVPGGGFGPLANQLLINNAAGSVFVTPVSSPSTNSANSSSHFDGRGESLGPPSVISSALLRQLAERLTTRAQQLSQAGVLSDLRQEIW